MKGVDVYLDKYGKKNAALSSLSAIAVGEMVTYDARKFGGVVSLRNAINYFMRRNPDLKFSTKAGYPDKETIYVKRIS
jgi:hypothetical protein